MSLNYDPIDSNQRLVEFENGLVEAGSGSSRDALTPLDGICLEWSGLSRAALNPSDGI